MRTCQEYSFRVPHVYIPSICHAFIVLYCCEECKIKGALLRKGGLGHANKNVPLQDLLVKCCNYTYAFMIYFTILVINQCNAQILVL